MKPVDKGVMNHEVMEFAKHGDAKPELLARLGEFCSYCECSGSAQQLHVEHIYPQTDTAHPKRAKNWRNFLVACSTCNTYKSIHLGNAHQHRLLHRFLWPHVDNTARAFEYHADGRVTIAAGLPNDVAALAEATREMVGLMRSPAAAGDYHALGIAYDGIVKREDAWGVASRARVAYDENPTANQLATLLDNAEKTGFFSLWMRVFHDRPDVRRALIQTLHASAACYDAVTTDPIARSRI